jgi:hypothetical protein
MSQNQLLKNFIINFKLSSKKFQKNNLIPFNLFIHLTFNFILIKISFQPISRKINMLFMRWMVYQVLDSLFLVRILVSINNYQKLHDEIQQLL